MLVQYLILYFVAVIAFALSAICGGGASFLLLPVLNLVLPGTQVPAALSVGTATSSISRMVIFYKNIRWDIVLWFVPPALPAVYLGAKLLSTIDPVLLELVIGIFLVINLPFIFKPAVKVAALPSRSRWMLSLIGLATGFLSGLTGAVGLLFNRFYLTYGMTKEQIIATRAANEILLHLLKLILYGLFGLLTVQAIGIGLIVSVAAIVSAQLVSYLVKLIAEKAYQKIGFAAMVISGAIMLFNAGFNLHQDQMIQLSVQRSDDKLDTKIKWKRTMVALEFEYDEGIEIERLIEFKDLPVRHQRKIGDLSKGASDVVIEEVFKFNAHYYELYVYRKGKLTKYKLQ